MTFHSTKLRFPRTDSNHYKWCTIFNNPSLGIERYDQSVHADFCVDCTSAGSAVLFALEDFQLGVFPCALKYMRLLGAYCAAGLPAHEADKKVALCALGGAPPNCQILNIPQGSAIIFDAHLPHFGTHGEAGQRSARLHIQMLDESIAGAAKHDGRSELCQRRHYRWNHHRHPPLRRPRLQPSNDQVPRISSNADFACPP
eukprot:355417-Chlamydomonas_euryale.AAC.6